MQGQMIRTFAVSTCEASHGKSRVRLHCISEHYYTCTKDILRGLGKMYAGGGDMSASIDRCGGEGTAEFAAAAIRIYCR